MVYFEKNYLSMYIIYIGGTKMTFEKFIKLIDILDHEGEILVMEDISEGSSYYDDENMREVDKISKYSDISECMKYFTESKYALYVYEKDTPYYCMDEL